MPSVVAWFISSFAPYVRAQLGRSERGASLVEYLLLAMLIAIVCIASITWFGASNQSKLSEVGSRIS